MKKIIKLGLISILVILAISSCNLLNTVSPSERLSDFEAELNTDSRVNTYQHIHSSATIYNSIKIPTWWDSNYFTPVYDNFDFTNIVIGADVSGIITATATITNSSTTWNVLLTFKESSSGDGIWYILTLTLDPGGPDELLLIH
jgi:hypothetical protein